MKELINRNDLSLRRGMMQDLHANKKIILQKIKIYDRSKNVNSFTVNGSEAWIDRDTRSSLAYSTKCKLDSGQDTTALWLNGFRIEINCEVLLGLLNQLEVYALNCYDVTEQHKANVMNLETIEDVINYDYTANYPDKLNVTL